MSLFFRFLFSLQSQQKRPSFLLPSIVWGIVGLVVLSISIVVVLVGYHIFMNQDRKDRNFEVYLDLLLMFVGAGMDKMDNELQLNSKLSFYFRKWIHRNCTLCPFHTFSYFSTQFWHGILRQFSTRCINKLMQRISNYPVLLFIMLGHHTMRLNFEPLTPILWCALLNINFLFVNASIHQQRNERRKLI